MEEEKVQDAVVVDDSQERVQAFIKEYGELVQKHKIDFANLPAFVPNENEPGSFKIMIRTFPVDMTKQVQPSPFIAQ